jgi:hypothetical protein
MDNNNFPAAATGLQPEQKKNNKNLIIGLLAALAVGLGGYHLYEKNKFSQALQQTENSVTTISNEKSEVQKSFDASLARLDSMTGVNGTLEAKIADQSTEIAKAKNQIRGILNKNNATVAELKTAKQLISQLNGKITSLEADVARLTEENKSLSQDKLTLTADKEKLTTDLASTNQVKVDLEKKVDIASTLNASNIVITPINVKSNGSEKVSTTAKRVDKLVISFDVNNRIAQPGKTDVYVLVIGPDGKPITIGSAGSGTFTTRDDGEKTFTAKVSVDVETAKKKTVDFAFSPGTSFQQGNYTIQIYQNGFLIGQGMQELKKGGLFS